MLQKIRETLHKYKKWEPLVFFTCGFGFDALLLHRIDNPIMLVHQAIYLTLCALIIAWDLFCEAGLGAIHPWLNRLWTYREGLLHFMLGTLLNVYTIFYFKSGSIISSFSFLLLLGLLLFLNEARPVQVSKNFLRNALFALCLISYMNILVSILVGSIGLWVFLLAIAVAFAINTGFFVFLRSRLKGSGLVRDIRLPFAAIAGIYVLLYVLKVLPPVPLSVRYMGIFREIKKDGEFYKLGYERPSWRFWEHGDQVFKARPGDKIYCFAQIFSPTRFKDELFVRWHYKEPNYGWHDWDAIPLNIVGGREEGYRGYTVKSNYQPGDWRVSIETRDGREVGRIRLEIEATPESDPPGPLNYEFR